MQKNFRQHKGWSLRRCRGAFRVSEAGQNPDFGCVPQRYEVFPGQGFETDAADGLKNWSDSLNIQELK